MSVPKNRGDWPFLKYNSTQPSGHQRTLTIPEQGRDEASGTADIEADGDGVRPGRVGEATGPRQVAPAA